MNQGTTEADEEPEPELDAHGVPVFAAMDPELVAMYARGEIPGDAPPEGWSPDGSDDDDQDHDLPVDAAEAGEFARRETRVARRPATPARVRAADRAADPNQLTMDQLYGKLHDDAVWLAGAIESGQLDADDAQDLAEAFAAVRARKGGR